MLRGAAIAAAVLVLTACGTGAPPTPIGASSPQVSISEEPSAASTADADLDTAAAFAKAVFTDDWTQAGTLVVDNSIAARYIAHQTAASEVDELNGTQLDVDSSLIDVTPNEGARTVTIEDSSGDKPMTYVWQDFQYDGGKIASWELEGKAKLASRLWTTKSSDSSSGVSASLVSAYQSSIDRLTVVVRLESSSKNVRITGAAYTPDDGYKHEDTANLFPDVDEGGKTQTYFLFNKAPVGGKLKLTVDRIDPDDDSSSYSLTSLTLRVR